MLKKVCLILALTFTVPVFAQQPAIAHAPTVAELQLQLAQLKQQLLQAEAQILGYQMAQAKADEQVAQGKVAEQQKKNADAKAAAVEHK